MHPDDKFFDYLLVTMPWEKDFMILINVTAGSHKLGAAYAGRVPVAKNSNKVVATKDGLRQAFGPDFEHCFNTKE